MLVTLIPYIWDIVGNGEHSQPSKVETTARAEPFPAGDSIINVLHFAANVLFGISLDPSDLDWTQDVKSGSLMQGHISLSLGLIGKHGKFESVISLWTQSGINVNIAQAKLNQQTKTAGVTWAVLLKNGKSAGPDTDMVNTHWAQYSQGLTYNVSSSKVAQKRERTPTTSSSSRVRFLC